MTDVNVREAKHGVGRREVAFEEVAYSNMLLLQALIDELSEKEIVNRAAILNRVKKLRSETEIHHEEATEPAPASASAQDRFYLNLDDLMVANRLGIETLVTILCDKGFLTRDEVAELIGDLRKRILAITRKH